jgi:cell wall-associated NlpC family hydrolase
LFHKITRLHRAVFVGALSVTIFALPLQQAVARDQTASLADRIFENAETLLESVKDVHYEHLHCAAPEQIQDSGMAAHNDCSGFVSYLLAKIAPKQYQAIQEEQPKANYPQAKTYAKFFTDLAPSDKHLGWLKIANFHDLKRGDFIAWAKPVVPGQKPGNSGHVAIVAQGAPELAEEKIEDKTIRFVSVKVIDSSSVDHFSPDVLPPNAGQKHRDGLGEGFVRVVLDADDKPIGYWEGTYWNEGGKPIKGPSYTSVIGFARLVASRD